MFRQSRFASKLQSHLTVTVYLLCHKEFLFGHIHQSIPCITFTCVLYDILSNAVPHFPICFLLFSCTKQKQKIAHTLAPSQYIRSCSQILIQTNAKQLCGERCYENVMPDLITFERRATMMMFVQHRLLATDFELWLKSEKRRERLREYVYVCFSSSSSMLAHFLQFVPDCNGAVVAVVRSLNPVSRSEAFL